MKRLSPRGRTVSPLIAAVAAALALAVMTAAPAQAAPPTAPTGVTASAGNAQVTVSWSAAPTATRYVVSAFLGSTAIGGCSTVTNSGATSCVVTGLTNGTAYGFHVQGQNFDGTGPASSTVTATPVAPATAPTAPVNVAVIPANGSVSVYWARPQSNGGSAITGYRASAWTAASGGTLAGTGLTTGAENTIIAPLTNGTTYYIEVTALNAAGLVSPPSARVPGTPTAPITVPGAPTGVTARAGTTSVTISWTPPASNGGSPILTYGASLFANPTGGTQLADCGPTGGTNACTQPGLTTGRTYYVEVTARNAAGDGPPSSPRIAVTPTAPSSGGGGDSPGGSAGGSAGGTGSGTSGGSEGTSGGGSGSGSGSGTSGSTTNAAAPTITGVSPARGPVTGGTVVTIRGKNFTGATKVTVGGVKAAKVVVVNATTIKVTTPKGKAGKRAVTVTTPGGTTTKAGAFTYVR